MNYSLSDILIKRIADALSQGMEDDPKYLASKILRIVFDELFIWLDRNGVDLQNR